MFRNASARADACRRLLRGQEMMMTDDIEWGPWIDWPGGECPIPWAKAGEYQIRFSDGIEVEGDLDARGWHWCHLGAFPETVVAYRVRADLMSWLALFAAQPQVRTAALCDCERSHNGLGLSGRECDCQEERAAALASLPPAAPDVAEKMAEALDEFAKHRNWELGFNGRFYADDDNPDTWQVWEKRGPVNDREWRVLGSSDTPAKAILAAYAASKEAGR